MNQPLVTIIIVSHNQARFIKEAVTSAVEQTYPGIEVIVVDDCSTDRSVEKIIAIERGGFQFRKILLRQHQGYCKAFNQGLALARGKYIIDLAADDVLMPTRVAQGVKDLESSTAGVNFCDAYYIDESSKILGTHYKRDPEGELYEPVADGDVYKQVLEQYFICAPTMMMVRKVLDNLGGYDETLFYEDFDFWVRSSRRYTYQFTNKVLVKKRVHKHSMSKSQYLPNSKMLPSTLKVCQKAYNLCKTKQELCSLEVRVRYELRQAILSNNYAVAEELHNLMGQLDQQSSEYRVWGWLLARRWNFSFLTRFVGKAR